MVKIGLTISAACYKFVPLIFVHFEQRSGLTILRNRILYEDISNKDRRIGGHLKRWPKGPVHLHKVLGRRRRVP